MFWTMQMETQEDVSYLVEGIKEPVWGFAQLQF